MTSTKKQKKAVQNLPPQKTKWALVEAPDPDTGEIWDHIVPIVEAPSFPSAEAAMEFLDRVEQAGPPGDPPCLTDSDDFIVATYFGHTLRKDCPCSPRVGGLDDGLLIHRQAN